MKKILIILCLLFTFLYPKSNIAQEYLKIQIPTVTPQILNKINQLGIDLSYSELMDSSLAIIVNSYELNLLTSSGITSKILVSDMEKYFESRLIKSNYNEYFLLGEYFRTGKISGYFSSDEIYSEFDRMMEKYPAYISKELIGYSVENRSVYAYCIGNRACYSDNDYPQVLITSLHHAREPGSVFTVLYYFWDLFERFENKNKNADFILNNRHIFVIPQINPDGVIFNEMNKPLGGGLWRKNRKINSDSSIGVDLNRNYGPYYAWNSSNKGSSDNGKIDTYRGIAPFSEPETQNINNFLKNKNIRIALNCHSFGNAVYIPYSYITEESPDSLWYWRFLTDNYRRNGYIFGRDEEAVNYTTRGSADDFLYISEGKSERTLSMTLELGNSFDSFWPPIDRMFEIAESNLDFFDNIIFSADKNISLFDKDLINFDNKFYIRVILCNIGYNKINEYNFDIKNTDYKLTIIQENYKGYNLERGSLDTFLIEFQPKDIINGDLAKFSINLDNDFEKNIEFEIPVYEFIEFNLLDKNELKNWEISLPWLIQDSILLSNSTLEYLPNLNSLAEYIIDLDSIEISRYTLRFDHKIEIESNYDFALIWVKDSNNTLFNHKMGDYSIRGSGKQNSKQDSTLWGFHGFFKYFMSQNVILNTLNQNIKSIMFNFKSDVANNKQGWKIKNLYLRKFPYKVVSSVKNKNKESEYSIYPNPANNYLFINPKIENELTESPTQFIIYNLSGNVISRQFINNLGKINISHLTPGIYYIQFNSKIEKFIKY